MTNTQIENFISEKISTDKAVTIHFKSRNPVTGLFIKTQDFEDLKTKNFWRIVGESNLAEFIKTRNQNLARIFNGADFTKLVSK
ncbi:MAG: short-chain dehydrogenase [Ferruginibacter sp.]